MPNDGQDILERIAQSREWLKSSFATDDFESDEDKELPQPPLEKPASGAPTIALTRDFAPVATQRDYLALLEARRSTRAFAAEPIALDELAFLLWSTQGVQRVIGNRNKATLRTVPSGGARHPMETYIVATRVDGLAPALYRYLPLEHALDRVADLPGEDEMLAAMLGQGWTKGAAVTLLYTLVPYRGEYRYCHAAHRIALIDAGHAMQNLYLSCEAIGCGTCAVGAYDQARCDDMLGVDGAEEFTFYVAPVGRKKG